MALRIPSLLAHAPPRCPLSRAPRLQGVKFKHMPPPGGQQCAETPPTCPRGHFNTAPRGDSFTRTAAYWTSGRGRGLSTPRGIRAFLGGLAVGAAAVHLLHTGTSTAMARTVDLGSAEGDWRQIKGEAQRVRVQGGKVEFGHMTKAPVARPPPHRSNTFKQSLNRANPLLCSFNVEP